MRAFILFSLATTAMGAAAFAAPAPKQHTSDGVLSPAALSTLRAQGPSGLQTLWTRYEPQIAAHRANPHASDAQWHRIEKALDTVAGQRDAWSAQLYWFTDLDAAKAAARAQDKPILSLRLLGKLTDEYSCANSRFFRTALYANEKVSQRLRDNFILHWQSERPVPIMTIDMGDGRVVKRTLTGNSAHYLLDATGRPLDALPGLYGPGAFDKWLQSSQTLFTGWNAQPEKSREEFLKNTHSAAIKQLAESFTSNLVPLRPQDRGVLETYLFTTPEANAYTPANANTTVEMNKEALDLNTLASSRARVSLSFNPSAESTQLLTASKAMIEVPMLTASSVGRIMAQGKNEEELWQAMAQRAAPDMVLDANSLNLMRTKTAQPIIAKPFVAPPANTSNTAGSPANFIRLPRTSELDSMLASPPPNEPTDVVSSFQNALAQDSVRNEYRMHAPIHVWFARGVAAPDLETFNERVYSTLFRTPRVDEWLGLAPVGIYAALEQDGLYSPKLSPASTQNLAQLKR